MKEVMMKEVVKLLDAGIIYPISNSKWISPTQVVPKKSDLTVVEHAARELIPQRTTTGWRVCIDYRELNSRPGDDNVHMSLWHFCLQTHALWPMQCTCHLLKMYDVNLLRHDRKFFGGIYG
jgi:hypothetical protein